MSSILRNIIKLRNDNHGPWGPFGGGSEKPSGNKKPKNSQNNADNFSKKLQKIFKDLFGDNNDGAKNPPKSNRSLFGIIGLIILTIWLASGLYKVDSNENAVVLYFGKFYSIATPGLNYHIPAPFGEIVKKSVTTVNTEDFSSSETFSKAARKSAKTEETSQNIDYQSKTLMLTGDENIVDIDFQVQWQISNIKDFIFNITEPNIAIRKAAESAMREIIAKTPIADSLSDGKRKIEQDTKKLLQEILDSYGAGVRVVLVQMRRVDPPMQVIDAFRDVQTAKADKEKEINQAQAYSNDIIPRARGAASQLTEQAQAYQQEVVASAEGQSSRFLAVYKEYVKAKTVTKKRMYLETMEKLYRDTDKVMIDKNLAKSGVVPYLPLNEMKKKK
jgi:modulator of FtsH protease HflK